MCRITIGDDYNAMIALGYFSMFINDFLIIILIIILMIVLMMMMMMLALAAALVLLMNHDNHITGEDP